MLGNKEQRARRYHNVFNLIRGLKFGKALDIGCADGEFTGRLGKVAYEVSGIDVSPTAIEQAKEALPGFDFKVGNATDLPFPDSSFYLVTCLDVLYYLDEEGRGKAADEVFRVLKPQGYFLVSTSWPFRTKTRTGMSYMRMVDVQHLLGSRFMLLDRMPTTKRFEIVWTGAALLFKKTEEVK